ncbi:transcription antitermination factor NusB [Nocardioides sp. GXZ039]|uniref:transcription antitermination factor NusB n=1 Tax=Nocardioides sp. GXZ039 TaxID=3136018 RepID=UPI0030F42042
MAARSKARRRALDLLYSAEMRGETPVEAFDRVVAAGEAPTNPYTETLVRGVAEETSRLDEVLAQYAEGWTLDRMPAVDRNVLRLGLWEMLHGDDVPDTVAISEAVALVRDLSTDDSPSFVNGVLGAIQRAGIAPQES